MRRENCWMGKYQVIHELTESNLKTFATISGRHDECWPCYNISLRTLFSWHIVIVMKMWTKFSNQSHCIRISLLIHASWSTVSSRCEKRVVTLDVVRLIGKCVNKYVLLLTKQEPVYFLSLLFLLLIFLTTVKIHIEKWKNWSFYTFLLVLYLIKLFYT